MERGQRLEAERPVSPAYYLLPPPRPLPQDSHIPRLQMRFWCELSFRDGLPSEGVHSLTTDHVCIYVCLLRVPAHTHTFMHTQSMVFILIILGQHQNFLLYPDHSEVMSSHARIYYMNKESFVFWEDKESA